jgi:Uncharacterised nucleotidyltransferase
VHLARVADPQEPGLATPVASGRCTDPRPLAAQSMPLRLIMSTSRVIARLHGNRDIRRSFPHHGEVNPHTQEDDSSRERGVSRRAALWVIEAMDQKERAGAWLRDPQGVPADLAWAAQFHGVEGWVRRRARADGLHLPAVDAAVHGSLARHQRALADLSRGDSALGARGVDYLVVKGPALVQQFYSGADLRSYVDLDLLVRPQQLGASVAALEEAGFVVLDANWPMLMRADVHELRLASPTGGAVDLHWSIGVGRPHADTSPSVDRLLARSVPVRLGPLEVRTPCWGDTVAHLAVHAAASGGHRLIWCADLRAALDMQPDVEAAALVSRSARDWRSAPSMHLMLARTAQALGVRVAADLARTLARPGPWPLLVGLADRAAAFELVGTTASAARLVARSARASQLSSCAAAARKALTASWGRGSAPPTAESLLDASDEASALFPAGGVEGACDFFRHVAESATRAGR